MDPLSILLRNASLPSRPGLHDVALCAGRIAAIRPAQGTAPGRDTHEVHNLDGRFVLPGLWDNHVHFTQWVIRQQRLDLTGSGSAADVLALVAAAVPAGTAGQTLVGFGFRDALWPDAPTRAGLDSVSGTTPVVLISADLHCLWVNTAAVRALGIAGADGGLVREAECFRTLEKLEDPDAISFEAYRRAADAAARRGVVGIVDFENADNLQLWPERVRHGVDALRVEVSVWPDRLADAVGLGVKTGDVLDERGLITMGPLKVIVDGSLNTRTAWCWDPYPGLPAGRKHSCGQNTVPVQELRTLMAAARDAGIGAAIHAIGDRANTAVLDTFEELGMTGVIEHAQLVREKDFARFRELGLAASVQPEHAMDDRDVADMFWPGRTGRAFALASLHRAGAPLRLGSDAPVAPLDPWFALASAVSRSRDGREPWHPEQCVPAVVALAASARGRSGVQVGEVADLAVTEADPLTATGEKLRTMPVSATLLGGRFTWRDF
ncbi:amidohydrolase family protein [Arthrobacter gengyunqii]|uniref:Amidohydrolase family protein n=1 Tax=Arthrobacter gengyunqii TaxID=2886940 RepID=A0A9X1S8J9_9MICC|nr:amidohydrolase family protein [Arthrobacter gengyunqii]MCC3270074.1 amidohydrolase family protein [Arthrobacter gengyunqii]UOY95012.1 amidohydrolase family protein [Arthrobacter gengyunqii]